MRGQMFLPLQPVTLTLLCTEAAAHKGKRWVESLTSVRCWCLSLLMDEKSVSFLREDS